MTQANAVVEKKKTHVALILDQSGSMAACLTPTILGFNEQVQTVKSNAKDGDEYFVSVVTFNHIVNPVQWNRPPEEIKELTGETYVPNGSTAMLDAVGQALSRLKSEADPKDINTSYLVVILSDGMENASREWTYSRVGELIQELKQSGRWTFTYMGANQDLSVIRDTLNIPAGNIALYKSDLRGTQVAFHANAMSTDKYLKCRKMGLTAMDDFYSADNEITDLTEEKPKDKP
jgi:uncharacterized protein YegL